MKIFVENVEFVGYHGVYEEERREGRRYRVDLAVGVDDPVGSESDELDHTIDYRELAAIVTELGINESFELIETLADRITTTVLNRFEQVRQAEVTVRKYATGVPGDPQWVGVTISRGREAS